MNTDMIIRGYREALMWTEEEELTGSTGASNQLITEIEADCNKFFNNIINCGITDFGDATLEQVGHDFWLTRNGHGSGFWDRPELYGENKAKALTECAEGLGDYEVYVGDDKLMYGLSG